MRCETVERERTLIGGNEEMMPANYHKSTERVVSNASRSTRATRDDHLRFCMVLRYGRNESTPLR